MLRCPGAVVAREKPTAPHDSLVVVWAGVVAARARRDTGTFLVQPRDAGHTRAPLRTQQFARPATRGWSCTYRTAVGQYTGGE